jgi:hypothetical protein
VVVYGNREDFLGSLLPDNVVVELFVERSRRWYPGRADLHFGSLRLLFLDDLATELYALIADIDLIRPGYQPSDLFLSFIAERTTVMHPYTSRLVGF